MKTIKKLIRKFINRDLIYFWMRKKWVNPTVDESKKKDKYIFSEKDVKIIKGMFKEYKINKKRKKKLSPEKCYMNVLKKLNFDVNEELRKKIKKGMELVWEILKNGKEAKFDFPVLKNTYNKKNKTLNSGLEGFALKTKEHVLIFVSEDFPGYEKKIIKMAKTALENNELIWFKITGENKQDFENEFSFAEDSYVVTGWSELIGLLKDRIWDPESLKEKIIDELLEKLIKKKSYALRIFCDEASKMLLYVKNPEGYLSFEGNWHLALNKADLPFLTLCTYRQNELREFLSKNKKSAWDIFKRLTDAHDKIIYFRREGEIFFNEKAIIRMIEDNFAGIMS